MAKSDNFLFVTLNSFSATGGIEKVCQSLSMVLHKYALSHEMNMRMVSMYDTPEQMKKNKYLPSAHCKGFSGKRLSFAISTFRFGINARFLILSHLNLLPIAWLVKLFSPKTKIILLAHGIEIWLIPPGIKKRMIGMVDNMVCVSRYTAQKAMSVFNIPEHKISVINNALDPFLEIGNEGLKVPDLKKKYGINQSDYVLFTLTRLDSRERYKGYDHVIKAMYSLKDSYPNLKYVIGGSSDAVELDFVQSLIQKFNLTNSVIITGFIDESELAAHFLMSDLFIMPSNQEGFGISFIEAMYFGLPVIGGNADGSVDALANGELGTLVTPGDIESIKQSIITAINQKGKNIPDHDKLIRLFGFETYQKKWENLLIQM